MEDLKDEFYELKPALNPSKKSCVMTYDAKTEVERKLRKIKSNANNIIYKCNYANTELDCNKFTELTKDINSIVGRTLIMFESSRQILAKIPATRQTGEISESALFNDISINYTNEGWLYAILPSLLPHTKQNINIKRALELSIGEKAERLFSEDKPKYFTEAVFIIRHIYAKNSLKRDNDNIEVSTIINVFSSIFMPDDSPTYCDNYYTGRTGKKDCTEIFIVPRNDFVKWISKNS